MSKRFDVVIVGGGIVGLSAALGMQTRGLTVAVIDADDLYANPAVSNARVYAINPASQRFLASLDVWQQLDPLTLSPYQHMHVWDAANGAHIDFDSRIIGTDKLGWIIKESVLKHALLCKVQALGVEVITNSRVTGINASPHEVEIQSGKHTWRAHLVIVADGGRSATRELLGVGVTSWPYHQHAVVATVENDKPHEKTAFQVFNPTGPLAFLPLSNAYQSSIVWSTTKAMAQQLIELPEDAFNQQLSKAFAFKLGNSRVLGPRYQFPLHMRHVKQYSGNRWLLMGDAAHSIHPLAGLGLNLGLADVASWLVCFDKSSGMYWSKATLGAYQRERKHAVWKMIALMGGLKTVFANPLLPVATLRGFGLSLCNQLPVLKRFFIEQAAG